MSLQWLQFRVTVLLLLYCVLCLGIGAPRSLANIPTVQQGTTGLITFRATIDWVPRYPLQYDSPTFVSVNNNASVFNISYADTTGLPANGLVVPASASGFIAREAIQISNVTAPNQAIGKLSCGHGITFPVAGDLPSACHKVGNDSTGILGLGFPRLSKFMLGCEWCTFSFLLPSGALATPFFATLASQGILDYPIFGLSLTRNTTGTLAIGAIDVSVVQNASNIVWNEVVPFSPIGTQFNMSGYFYWAIHMTGFSVNGTNLTPMPTYPTLTDNSSIALLDVGTTGIYGPYQDVTRLYSLISGSRLVDESGQWVVPCTSSATISFTFGDNNTFVLQPTDYISVSVNEYGSWFTDNAVSPLSYGIDDEEPPMIATVATTLPNYVLATPSYTTPPYTFNTSVPATFGEIVASELATSTYAPILVSPTVYDAYTMVYTNSEGQSVTSTYHVSDPTTALGVPPGWSGAHVIGIPYFGLGISLFIAVSTTVCVLS
ncbi:acid protease [Pisolithus microcarpus]|nr:acid protease [Pisolithus microcarpus]